MGGEEKVAKRKGSKPRRYICSTCGIVTTAKGHLCSPVALDKAVKCEYCGVLAGNARHVCKPKAAKIGYVCDACGRMAVRKTEICVPKKI